MNKETMSDRTIFISARPLLLLNPRSPTNIAIVAESWALPILERLADRMEAELRRLVDAGLPIGALPVVNRLEIRHVAKDRAALIVELEESTLPEAAKDEFLAARKEAVMDLTGPFGRIGAEATIKWRDENF